MLQGLDWMLFGEGGCKIPVPTKRQIATIEYLQCTMFWAKMLYIHVIGVSSFLICFTTLIEGIISLLFYIHNT